MACKKISGFTERLPDSQMFEEGNGYERFMVRTRSTILPSATPTWSRRRSMTRNSADWPSIQSPACTVT
jgi:hypothetical protein